MLDILVAVLIGMVLGTFITSLNTISSECEEREEHEANNEGNRPTE